MGQIIKIRTNPEILIWAREEAGYTPDDLADKLHIPVDRFNEWETTGKNIPLGMLKRVANYYKRQLAVFCLPTSPPKIKKPTDFRNLAIDQQSLSNETLLIIRRTNKYLKLANELDGEEFWKTKYNWINEIDKVYESVKKVNDPKIITWLRNKLEIDIEKQKKFKGFDEAFKTWRSIIEKKLGIFVFQFPMPEGELDGFTYAFNKPPYAIIINSNSNNLPQRKTFTLFHELGHILKHQSGICFTDLYRENQLELEYECNDFAGRFLVPDNYVYPIDSKEELVKLSKTYHVSREVYLRRSYENGLISKIEFFNYLKAIKETTKIPKKKKEGFAINPAITSKSQRGETFYNLVVDAAYNNRIDFSTATDILNLKINHILNE